MLEHERAKLDELVDTMLKDETLEHDRLEHMLGVCVGEQKPEQ